MTVGRVILALLLAAMAVGQMSDPIGFAAALEDYGIGGPVAAWIVGTAAVAAEGTAAALLLLPGRERRRKGGALAVLVAAGWSALAVQAFARSLTVPNCGCFGVHFTQSLRWEVLVQDAVFLAEAAWVSRRLATRSPRPWPRRREAAPSAR